MLSPIRLDIETLVASPLPVDLDLIKQHCAVDSTDQDELLETYLIAAINAFENTTHRTLFRRGHVWVLKEFPFDTYQHIWLPRGKTRSVDMIEYVSNGETVTLTGPTSGSPMGADWQEDLRGDDGGLILPPRGQSWASVDSDAPDPVTVYFTAGWGVDELPSDILNALLWYVRTSLDDARTDPQKSEANMRVFESLVSGHRLTRFY